MSDDKRITAEECEYEADRVDSYAARGLLMRAAHTIRELEWDLSQSTTMIEHWVRQMHQSLTERDTSNALLASTRRALAEKTAEVERLQRIADAYRKEAHDLRYNISDRCTCAAIQAADGGRHFKGCPLRVERSQSSALASTDAKAKTWGDKPRFWDVRYVMPPTEKTAWRSHHTCVVVAEDATSALAKVMAKHPEATVHGLHARSARDGEIIE